MPKKIEIYVQYEFLNCDNCCINYTKTGKGWCQYRSIEINNYNRNQAEDCPYWLPDGTNRAMVKRKMTNKHKCWYEEVD